MIPPGPHREAAPGHSWAFAKPKRALALPLSIALHLIVVYSVARTSWDVAEVVPPSAPANVVWLSDLRALANANDVAATLEEAPPEPSSTVADNPPTIAPREAQVVAVAPSPVEPPSDVSEELPPSSPRPNDTDLPPATTTPEPSARDRAYVAPGTDWEKERQQAAARVLEQREREGAYPTFSLDDVVKPREEPTPPTKIAEAIADPCKVASNKFEKFALQMIGRCVREARGDLFADIKPAYMRNRPLCEETRPGAAPVMDARGNEISTVKCRLVDDDEYAEASTGE